MAPSLAGPEGAHNVGDDPMRPAVTEGINLHHLCLRITNPESTLRFFREVLGMRKLFSYNAGSFSIYYMHHSSEETAGVWAKFPDQKGLIELIHRHGSEDDGTTYTSGNGVRGSADRGAFAHLGFIVDDVPKLVERALAAGAKLEKPQGECSPFTIGWPEDMPSPIQAYHKLYSNMAMISFDNIWMELVPRVLENVEG